MLKNAFIAGFIVFAFFLHALPARAAETSAPPPVTEAIDDPFTVSGVTVDKTDKNAVVARTAAIAEAKRTALQKLAERNLDAGDLKGFKLPDDAAISAVVQDFEITSERLSRTRYVATFTVRFRPGVGAYVDVRAKAPGKVAAAAVTTAVKPRSILVLPYFQDISGKVLLWEDSNVWLKAWQDALPTPPAGWAVAVPLGDIGDVAAGDAAAVWSGGYDAVEKLRVNYGADEVVLPVANKSGPQLTIDMYVYRDGKLDRTASLTPVSADFAEGIAAVMQSLKNPPAAKKTEEKEEKAEKAVEEPASVVDNSVAAPPFPTPAVVGGPVAPPPAAGPAVLPAGGGPTTIDARMNFDDFSRWMELQKRVTAMTPPASIDIKTISSTSAAFTLRFDGGMETLKSALAAHGIALDEPVVEVGGPQTAQKPVYALQLVN
jgi:hypothetical protein